jgi:hypothetical protein
VLVNKEVLDADESTHIGKLLARGLAGFFTQGKGFGGIMAELERKYSVPKTSGGSRQAVQSALEELVAKGILDRQTESNQWIYMATPEFAERVNKK